MGRGVARRDLAHVTLKVKLCMLMMVSTLSLQVFVWPKYYFWPIFGPGMKTEMGVVIYMYFKDSPHYVDSKYILVHESISPGSSVLAEIPFLAFSILHRERKRCGQVEPSPWYSQSEVIYAYQVFNL